VGYNDEGKVCCGRVCSVRELSSFGRKDRLQEMPVRGYVNKMGVSRVIKVFDNPKDASELVKELNSLTNVSGFKQLG